MANTGTKGAGGPARIAGIFRYPVKGLSGEALDGVDLAAGETLPFDRAFAIENGPGGFDPEAPRHLPKTAFVMLMRHERLAELDTRFDPETTTLEIRREGASVASGRLGEEAGRAAIERFIAGFIGERLRGPPRIVASPGHSFSDVGAKCVSIINLESVREIERVAGQTVEPIRFRGNIHVDGLAPWAEFGWVGREVRVGEVRLAPFKRTARCAATTVNPRTARRDINIPDLLVRAFGHAECGIYARVVSGGRLERGMAARIESADEPRPD
jgi:uncharacterized protein YcbX